MASISVYSRFSSTFVDLVSDFGSGEIRQVIPLRRLTDNEPRRIFTAFRRTRPGSDARLGGAVLHDDFG